MSYVINGFAAVGFLSVALFSAGLVYDFRDFDRTSGGYEAPYTGVTGEPVDWSKADRTATGLVKRGYVIDVHVNGTTGMITFETFGMKRDFRPLSGRALAVHNPREAMVARGFDPQF